MTTNVFGSKILQNQLEDPNLLISQDLIDDDNFFNSKTQTKFYNSKNIQKPNDSQNLLSSSINFFNTKKLHPFKKLENSGYPINFNAERAYDISLLNSQKKFAWKEIIKNYNILYSNPDINFSDPLINNLINSELTENDIQTLPESYIINLVTFLQAITHRSLKNEEKYNEQINSLKEEIQEYKNIDLESIKAIQDENLSLRNRIKDYEKIMNEIALYNNCDLINPENKENIAKILQGKKIKEKYYCQFCSNKKFKTEQFLEEHMRRRHMAFYNKIKNNELNNQMKTQFFEKYTKKMEEMKNIFTTLISQTQMRNNYSKLNDKLNSLEFLINNKYNLENNVVNNYTSKSLIPKDQDNEINILIKKINDNMKENEKYESKIKEFQGEMQGFELKVKSQINNFKKTQLIAKDKENFNNAVNDINANGKFISPLRRRITKPSRGSKIDSNDKSDDSSISQNKKNTINPLNKNEEIEKNNFKDEINNTDTKNKIKNSSSNEDGIKMAPNNQDNNSVLSQTLEEKLLEDFYKKFINRDKNFEENKIQNYLIRIIPDEYYDNKENKNILEYKINNKLENNNTSEKSDELININQKIEDETADNSTQKKYYSLYLYYIEKLLKVKENLKYSKENHFLLKNLKEDNLNQSFETFGIIQKVPYKVSNNNYGHNEGDFSFSKIH